MSFSGSVRDEVLGLEAAVAKRIVGQDALIRRLLIALVADGHLLVEGPPGLAKTSVVKTLASGIEGDFHRIQFTPDLLPADLTGTEVFRPETGDFTFREGPLFHHFLLADEINRSPAKVQSALLEAMAERQVTVGRATHPLPRLFLVMATQNPIEQEGTYPLPEAQRDRFLLHVRVGYPDHAAEREILRLVRDGARADRPLTRIDGPKLSQDAIFAARRAVLDIHVAEAVEDYIVTLVAATRDPAPFDPELAGWIAFGASPRGSIALDLAARAHAWLEGRDYVSPGDVQAMAADALRHRVLLGYEAEARGHTPDEAIARLLAVVAAP